MTIENLRIFIQTLTSGREVADDSLLFKDKFLNSMNILSLIGFVESELGRRLQDEEIALENFASINAIMSTFHVNF